MTRGRDRLPGQPSRVRRASDIGGVSVAVGGVIDFSYDGELTLDYTVGLENSAGSLIVHFLDGEILPLGTGLDYSLGYYLAADELRIVDGINLNADIRMKLDSSGHFDFIAGNLTSTGIGTFGYANITDESNGFQVDGVRILSNEGVANVWLGEKTGEDWTTGYNNVCIGFEAGKDITDARDNTCIGFQAGRLINTGLANCIIGSYAGWSLTSGDYNTCFGIGAGRDSTGGDHNTFIGYNAGLQHTSGNKNTCLGVISGYSLATSTQNVMVGYAAGYYATNARDSVVIGPWAGFNLTNGENNVLIGRGAGLALTTGDCNIIIGREANAHGADAHAMIVIGHEAVGTTDHQMLLGTAFADYQITDIYLGSGVVKVSPDDVTVNATGGSGTDNAGADLILAGGKSTGNATPGNVVFQVSTAGASGATLQTLATVLTLSGSVADFVGLGLTTTGLGTFGNLDVDTLNLNGNVISDSTGTISFDDDNLETSGTVTAGTAHFADGYFEAFLGTATQAGSFTDAVQTVEICNGTYGLEVVIPDDGFAWYSRDTYVGNYILLHNGITNLAEFSDGYTAVTLFDGVWSLNVGGASSLGDGGLIDYTEITAEGDVVFHGTAGLQFGSCYGVEVGWIQANAVQNTWYDISDADMVDGQLHGITHDGNGQLTVGKTGMYAADWAGAFEADAANVHVQITFSVNGTEVNPGMNHFETVAVSREYACSGNAILDLTVDDTVNVSMRTTDAGTPDLLIDHLMLRLIQIGGM